MGPQMYDLAEFRHFKYLLAIAENGGFRAAADKLRVSQPSLSKQAREFQQFFNLVLFKKTKSGRTRLTPVGTAFIPIARDLLQAREEAIGALISIQQNASTVLRLGCSSFVDPEICSATCSLYKQVSPLSEIRPTHGEASQLLNDLNNGRIDVAIITSPVGCDDLSIEPISQDRLVACLPEGHPLASKVSLSPADLDAHLRIFRQPSEHPVGHAHLTELLENIGVTIRDHARTSHPQETMKLVKNSFGFALIREGTLLDEGLTTRPILGVNWTVDTVMVFRPDTKLKHLPIMARILRRELAERSAARRLKKPSDSSRKKTAKAQADLFGKVVL